MSTYLDNKLSYLFNIINELDKNVKPFTTIYVAIGCAANMRKYDEDKKCWILDQEYDHEFPICLKKLKNVLPWEPLHCIYIDPLLEKDPHMVSSEIENKLDENWTIDEKNSDIYHNDVSNIHVYCCRFNATTVCDLNRNTLINSNSERSELLQYVDITHFLEKLNELAIKNNWFVLYHDFTGRDINLIASYFDNQLKGHRNHIVFGIGVRHDGGCYIDLRLPECDFYYTWFDNGIQVFNPYVYDDSISDMINMGKQIIEYEDENVREIIHSQIKVFLKSKIHFLSETIIEVFRKITMLKSGNTAIGIENDKISYFLNTHKINITELLELHNYEYLHYRICNVVKDELRQFFSMFGTPENADNVMEKLLGTTDPYKYHSIVKEEIDKCMKYMLD